MPLRDYQSKLKQDVYDSWQGGARNVLAQLPTGGGKTVVKAAIVEELNDAACCIAHRRELVSQISLALAREGVRHRIIAPDSVIKFCAMLQVDRVGRSFVYPNAPVAVAGVDSLLRPSHALDQFAKRCALWVQDESHHLLAENKWGRAIDRFSNAKGLGVTATPCRTDGKGLGRHAHGVMDDLIIGPSPRELTQQGYLSDYRIICARDHIEGLSAGGSGEYTGKSVDEEVLLLGQMFGADLSKPGLITPTQAEKKGIPQEIITGYCTRKQTGVKLTESDDTNIANIFNGVK